MSSTKNTHHQHDEKWIREMMNGLTIYQRNNCWKMYKVIYQQEHDREQEPHRKECKARQAANKFLREVVEEGKRYQDGYATDPK